MDRFQDLLPEELQILVQQNEETSRRITTGQTQNGPVCQAVEFKQISGSNALDYKDEEGSLL